MGTGFGKTILFGEHFVVYGLPAIASAVSRKTEVRAKKAENDKLIFTYQCEEEDKQHLRELVEIIKKKMNLNEKFELTISTDIPLGAGMGSSAAFCVAAIRALVECVGRNLGNEDVNRIAFEGEKKSHGTPSGIDNTVATFGGLVWFQKNLSGGANTIETMKIAKPLEIVIGNTGKKGNTKELVERVRQRKEKDPEKYDKIFSLAKEIVLEAKKELQEGNVEKLGELMNKNHELLKEIGVSTKELNSMIKAAKKAGALGAKLTGAGGGGCMIALCPGKQKEVSQAIKKLGFKTIETKIGV